MNITFTFLESLRSETSPESLSKMPLPGPKYHTKGVDQRKLRRAEILAYILHIMYIYIYYIYYIHYIYIYIYIYYI